ncbi:CorA family divalent cation transporter [Liberiplasma polymorphum]|uniref:CorA family divalent cation transporter n=1 Tax=Liberiplasma polymorphum TaxID=3374570 RepID=UPI0037765226
MKIKNYFTPKSFVYTGEHHHIETKIVHYHFNDTTLKMSNNFKPLDFPKHYIQVIGLNDIEKIQALKEYYTIDSLILEDVFNVKQRNKIEVKPAYLFGVFHIEHLHEGEILDDYMSLFMFKDTIISFHETEPVFLQPLHALFETHKEIKEKPIDYLFYQILDIITDQHIDVFDEIENYMSVFEEEILGSKNINQEDFYIVRKQLLRLKNSVTPTLEQLERALERSELFTKESEGYFEDLTDHLKRLDSQVNQARELMRNLLDLHINNQSNKMNRIMTTLTLFSAIFIPLSFLTGFFGMNFVHFDILEYEYSLGIFIAMCFILAGLMFLLFKKMKWF